jgi:endo-1,4-beta-xylanase
MAAFLYRLAGEPNGPSPDCTEAPFTDVPITHLLCGEIEWLTDNGVTFGYEDGSFGPGAGVSRQAMAAFLERFRILTV